MRPWSNHHENSESTEIEHEDAYRNGIDRSGHHFSRIPDLCRCCADDFHSDESEDGRLKSRNHSIDTFGEKATV